jgi:hypothetical protein
MIARLLREPLLHFLIAGGLLFAIFGNVGTTDAVNDDHRIVVSDADIERVVPHEWPKSADCVEEVRFRRDWRE